MRSLKASVSLCALAVLTATPVFAKPAPLDLIAAVQDNDHPAIRKLLAAGADPNSKRPDGSTALTWAVDRQDLDSVKMLLAAKANPNIVDQDGVAPLAVACERGGVGIVEALVAAKAKADVARPDGIPAIAMCAANSQPSAVARLVAAGADVNSASPLGQTPLMFAASTGNVPNIEALVKAGAKVNQASKGGFTPLLFAAKSKVDAAPLTIIKLGGDANYAAPDGTTALEIALLQKQYALATSLINDGGDINHWDANGKQPLHIAAIDNQIELAKLLIAKGANPNALTKQPYRIIPNGKGRERPSTWPDNDPTVKVVLAHRSDGAGPPAPPAATTPLMLAAQYGNIDMMKALMAAGAKPDYKAPDGSNLVIYAVNSGRADTVRYAITLNSDVNSPTTGGQTAVFVALGGTTGNLASQHTFEGEPILRILAENGANLNAKNAQGQSALDVAGRSSDEMKAFFAKLVQEQSVKKTASLQ